MRVCRLGYAVVVLAIIGTLAIFLLPLPRATAPYPATHGPVGYTRCTRMALIWMLRAVLLLSVVLANSLSFLVANNSAVLAHVPGYRAQADQQIPQTISTLRC